jgi:sugar O-acyltransferase (sialic acid O-acetyltransferase NeuD family)
MPEGLLVWGAGGHEKVVAECAVLTGRFNRIAFIDDRFDGVGEFFGLPVLGSRAALTPAVVREYRGFIAAIGDNHKRAACFECALSVGLVPQTLIHPSAVVSPAVTIGEGTILVAGAVINAGAIIGRNCIINTAATVGHDCVVGDHVHISPHSALAGESVIGAYVHLGIGAVTIPGTVVGEGSVIGAGALLRGHIPANVTAVGVPARIVVRR